MRTLEAGLQEVVGKPAGGWLVGWFWGWGPGSSGKSSLEKVTPIFPCILASALDQTAPQSLDQPPDLL